MNILRKVLFFLYDSFLASCEDIALQSPFDIFRWFADGGYDVIDENNSSIKRHPNMARPP